LFFSNSQNSKAQINLVPNGSFENLDSCPNFGSQLYFAKPWYAPQYSSTDLFSTCDTNGGMAKLPCTLNCNFSYQYAKDGNTMAGFFTLNNYRNYKEYLQVKLNDTLMFNQCYLLKFYVNQPNFIKMSSNGIGAYFSSNPDTQILYINPGDPTILPYQPQIMKKGNPIITDTLGWVTIAGIFTSNGTETFLTIGSFTPDSLLDTTTSNSAGIGAPYYFIDDVSVIEATPQNMQYELALHDTTITEGSTIKIGEDEITGIQYAWYVNNNFIDTTGIITIHPTSQTTYVRQMSWCGYTWNDTVKVSIGAGINNSIRKNKIELFPNPSDGKFSISSLVIGDTYAIEVTNCLGQKVYTTSFVSSETIADISLQLNGGIYLVIIKNNTKNETIIRRMAVE
jgi:hypothetical protein